MFDIGVNLTSSQFAKDRRAVVERARVAGVTGMLITGTDLAESREAAELAQQHAGYGWSTAGVHPHYASGWDEHTAEQIYALARALKWRRSANAARISIATSRRPHSRKRRSPRSWRWRRSWRCRCFSTAATHTHVLPNY